MHLEKEGFVTTRIAESLQKRGIKLTVIGADGWLNLPHVRFHQQDLANHFYEKAIRFDEKKLLRRLLR